MNYNDDKLIEKIKDTLSNHEHAYEEGAWETFRDVENSEKSRFKIKKTRLLLIAAAASLVIFLCIQALFNPSVDVANQPIIGVNIDSPITNPKENRGKTEFKIRSKVPQVGLIKNENNKASENREAFVPLISPASLYADPLTAHSSSALFPPSNSVTDIQESEQDTKGYKSNGYPIDVDRLSNRDVALARDTSRNSKVFSFGVELLSSIGAEKLNFGGGIHTEFEISRKVSFATGIAYTRMEASNDSELLHISETVSRVGLSSSIQAIDIPLSIIYKFNNEVYVSLGVSAVAVLKESVSRQYESSIISETLINDPATGEQVTIVDVQKKEFSELSDETENTNFGNAGFLNISVGKKQPFHGGTEIQFEPFLKVPLGNLTRQELDFMNAGLKIKLMF